MVAILETPYQIPLIHVVESDDLYLAEQADVLWFTTLRDLDWRVFVDVAAQYYEALWAFNQAQRSAREERERGAAPANPETREQADRRLLFARPTMDETAAVLHVVPAVKREYTHVNPATLRPGRVPFRLAGRTPKCFFRMLKAFLGMALLGRSPEPEFVQQELDNNPSYARVCGFTLPDPRLGYRASDIPALRKIEQFDQIMTQSGLWDQAALAQIRTNFARGIIKVEPTLVHDTTHYEAHSAYRVVETLRGEEPPVARRSKPPNQRRKKKGARHRARKSQSKTTKRCRCADRTVCAHAWIQADEGAGTVVKQRGKMVWGHKASTMACAGQEVLLDAVAMSDAATHDSRSLLPHLARLFTRFPNLRGKITKVLDDGALDDAAIRERVLEDFAAELYASPNPRARQPIHKDLGRGLDHLTSLGVPVCSQGYPFGFVGCRHADERFLFRAPDDEEGHPVCAGCPAASDCLRPGAERRHVTVAFDRLPFLDPRRPYLSKRFHKTMARRTVIERLHKLMKFDYGDSRLTKRGNDAFQARLDKTLLAMHVVLSSG